MIKINEESLFQTESGKVMGIIYLDFEDLSFPLDCWDDFVSIILNWWAIAIIEILNGNSKNTKFYFMDGPYYANLTKKNNSDLISMELIENREKQYCIGIKEIHTQELIESLKKNLNMVIRICQKKRWKDEEINQMEINLVKLQNKI